jgi:hypothetical protein
MSVRERRVSVRAWALLVAMSLGCRPSPPPVETTKYGCGYSADGGPVDTSLSFDTAGLAIDNDGDGVTELEGDCNDNNCQVHPFATERNDGLDTNCDGEMPVLYGCGQTGSQAGLLLLPLLLVRRRR